MTDTDNTPPASPMGPQTGRIKSAGRRPKGRVMILLGGVAALVIGSMVYTVYKRQVDMQSGGTRTAEMQETGGTGAIIPSDLMRDAPARQTQTVTAAPATTGEETPEQPAQMLRQAQRPAEPTQDDQDRIRARQDAMNAGSSVQGFEQRRQQQEQATQQAAAPTSRTAPVVPSLQTTAAASGAADPNGQSQKLAFLDREPATDTYLSASRTAPRSKTELKAGTVIPAIMVGGINSDLPGQIVGQVARNVYDSATGQYLLIPAGAKVVGNYDSQVAHGQTRVLVAWERIIFPDGSSISLGAMTGTDVAGYSGFKDKVNRHFWRTFGDALMLSVLSAGAAISQGGNDSDNMSASELAAAAMGQQFAQLGTQMVQQNMNIQPTLEIRPGYQFNVMLSKDVILPQWKG